jgi:hypothetical protein
MPSFEAGLFHRFAPRFIFEAGAFRRKELMMLQLQFVNCFQDHVSASSPIRFTSDKAAQAAAFQHYYVYFTSNANA